MRGELDSIQYIFLCSQSKIQLCLLLFVARDPMCSYKEQDDFYSKMKHLYTLGPVRSTHQFNYNS